MTTNSRRSWKDGGGDLEEFFPHCDPLAPEAAVFSRMIQPHRAACLSLVRLAALEPLLARGASREKIFSLFSARELDIFHSYSRFRRKLEWIGGRLAAKTALGRIFDDGGGKREEQAGYPEILPAPDRRPLVILGTMTTAAHVSISHSGDYAVAMAHHRYSCGVDLQNITSRLKKVVSRFADEDEIRLLAEHLEPFCGRLQRLCLLWSAKEAYKKSLCRDQPPGFADIRLRRIQAASTLGFRIEYRRDPLSAADVHVALFQGYTLAHIVHRSRRA